MRTALVHPTSAFIGLKRFVVLYDQIALPLGMNCVPDDQKFGPYHAHTGVFRMLQREGLLLDLIELPGFEKHFKKWAKKQPRVRITEVIDEGIRISPGIGHVVPHRVAQTLRGLVHAAEQSGVQAVPAYETWHDVRRNYGSGSGEVARVVLKTFPLPLEYEVEWENIIELKRSKVAMSKLHALRGWMRRQVDGLESGSLSKEDVAEELQDLLADWRRALGLAENKLAISHLEFLLPVSLGAGAMIGSKFAIAPTLWTAAMGFRGLFQIMRSRVDLQEAESKRPEVAFIATLPKLLGGRALHRAGR